MRYSTDTHMNKTTNACLDHLLLTVATLCHVAVIAQAPLLTYIHASIYVARDVRLQQNKRHAPFLHNALLQQTLDNSLASCG